MYRLVRGPLLNVQRNRSTLFAIAPTTTASNASTDSARSNAIRYSRAREYSINIVYSIIIFINYIEALSYEIRIEVVYW